MQLVPFLRWQGCFKTRVSHERGLCTPIAPSSPPHLHLLTSLSFCSLKWRPKHSRGWQASHRARWRKCMWKGDTVGGRVDAKPQAMASIEFRRVPCCRLSCPENKETKEIKSSSVGRVWRAVWSAAGNLDPHRVQRSRPKPIVKSPTTKSITSSHSKAPLPTTHAHHPPPTSYAPKHPPKRHSSPRPISTGRCHSPESQP